MALSIFTARALPIVPSVVVSAFFGFIQYDIKRYITITFLGTLVKAFLGLWPGSLEVYTWL